MNLSDALAREARARPARVLHGAHRWQAVAVPVLDDVPPAAAAAGAGARGALRRGGHVHADQALDAARIESRIADAFADGLAEGRRQHEAETAERDAALGAAFAERCERTAAAFAAGIEELERRLADRVLQLAMTLAERIACQSLASGTATIEPVLAEALARLTAPWRSLDVVAHPDDCPVIEAWLAGRDTPAGARITVRADPSLSPGGCRVEADDTSLDATLETRIRRAFEALGGEA